MFRKLDFMENFIEEFITFINDLVNDEFGYWIDDVDSEYYFLHGGCLEFAKVLHHYLNGSYIVIRDDFEHFAVEYKGICYDATGKVEGKNLYHRLTWKEILNIEHYYGISSLRFENQVVHSAVIRELNCCNGDYVKKLLCHIHQL